MVSLPSTEPISTTQAAQRAAYAWLDEATDGATRMRQPLRIEVVRPVSEADLTGSFLAPAPAPTLAEIKSAHHSLAKLLAGGRNNVEASRITGYSTSYIARLRGDPLFRELLLHYSEVEELASTDFLGAMRAVGMDMLGELQRRVEEDPKALPTGTLLEGIKLLLVEPMKAEASRIGGGAGIAPITISFVASATPQASESVTIENEAGK